MHVYSFEKLDVWVEAKELAKRIYMLTSKFSDSEKYGLTSQLRRAAVSICSNIAEGSARSSYKDKAHFTTMAFGSTLEILNQLIISSELNFLQQEEYLETRFVIESITRKLNSLKIYQINQANKPS